MSCTYQSRNPLAATSPLRSYPWGKPAYLVMGVSAQVKAEAELRIARNDLPGWQQVYADARAALGRANRFAPATRRWWQADAMRKLNAARKALRAAIARVAVAEIALAALAVAQA